MLRIQCSWKRTPSTFFLGDWVANISRPLAHLGQSDHVSILLIPVYSPIRKSTPITTRNAKTWPADPTPLQISLHDTGWEEYEHEDLERFTSIVLQHVRSCADSFTVDKRVRVYPDTKPWMNRHTHKQTHTQT